MSPGKSSSERFGMNFKPEMVEILYKVYNDRLKTRTIPPGEKYELQHCIRELLTERLIELGYIKK